MIITNPDMLHQSILPLHGQFATLLSNLKYIIVDEGHAYRQAVFLPASLLTCYPSPPTLSQQSVWCFLDVTFHLPTRLQTKPRA